MSEIFADKEGKDITGIGMTTKNAANFMNYACLVDSNIIDGHKSCSDQMNKPAILDYFKQNCAH